MNIKIDIKGGIGLVITIVLAILKLTSVIDISWGLVFLPFGIGVVIILALILAPLAAFAITMINDLKK